MPQRLWCEHDRIEVEPLEIFAWLFLEFWTLALLRENVAAVVHSRRVGWQIASAMGGNHLQIGIAVERALEDEMGKRNCRLQRIADDVAEGAAALGPNANAFGVGLRMNEDRALQSFGLRPERIVFFAGDFFALDASADCGAGKTKVLDGLLQLLGRQFRKLKRHGSERHESVRRFRADGS